MASRVQELEARVAKLEEQVAKLLGEPGRLAGDRTQPVMDAGAGIELRIARVNAGWRSIDVARSIGCSPGYYCDYEREYRRIPVYRAQQIHKVFVDGGVTPPDWTLP